MKCLPATPQSGQPGGSHTEEKATGEPMGEKGWEVSLCKTLLGDP